MFIHLHILNPVSPRICKCVNLAQFTRAMRRSWAQLIKRIYEVDPLVCPSCGSEMKVIAFITEHAVVDRILRHLKRRVEDEREKGPPGRSGIAAVS